MEKRTIRLPKCNRSENRSWAKDVKQEKQHCTYKFKEFKLPLLNTGQGKKKLIIEQTLENYATSAKPLISIPKKEFTTEVSQKNNRKNKARELSQDAGEKLNESVLKNSSCYRRPLLYTETLKLPRNIAQNATCKNSYKDLYDRLADSKKILSNLKVFKGENNSTPIRDTTANGKSSEMCNLPRVVAIEFPKDTSISKNNTLNWQGQDIQTVHSQKWWTPNKEGTNIEDTNKKTELTENTDDANDKDIVSSQCVKKNWVKAVQNMRNIECQIGGGKREISVPRTDSLTSAELLEWLKNNKCHSRISTTKLEIPDEVSIERIPNVKQRPWFSSSSQSLEDGGYGLQIMQESNPKQTSLSLVNIGGTLGKHPKENSVHHEKDLSITMDADFSGIPARVTGIICSLFSQLLLRF